MSLTIGRLETHVSFPRQFSTLAPVVDRVARGALPRECGHVLGSVRHAPVGVCRIRRINIRLRLAPKELTDETLAKRWADALRHAVTSAIERTDHDVDIVVADTRAAWVAAYLARRASGEAPSGWVYLEFASLNALPIGEAAVSLFEDLPQVALAALAIMDAEGSFERLLAAMSESQCARLCGVLDRADLLSPAWAIAELVAISRLLLDHPRRRLASAELATNARALAVFVSQLQTATVSAARNSMSRILAVVRVLDQLCALRRVVAPDDFETALTHFIPQLPTVDLNVLRRLAASGGASSEPSAGAREGASARELATLVERLLVEVPASGMATARDLSGQWRQTDAAGFFLLVPVIQALRWPERLVRSRLWSEYGPRAMTYLLTGIALALKHVPIDETARLDAGATLFAGWAGELYFVGFHRFAADDARDARADLVGVLMDAGVTIPPESADTWTSTFEFLTGILVRAFAARLRGFRQSRDAFIVRSFLNVPGRVLVEPSRLRVVLDRNPLWVVVHLAGADDHVERVAWLGDRSVEFELEGL